MIGFKWSFPYSLHKMTSQIDDMFSTIKAKIDEEYSRIMTTFHKDISTNLSTNDFTEGYGMVDLEAPGKQHKFTTHPKDGWFIYILENTIYIGDFNRSPSIFIDNYGNYYRDDNTNLIEYKIDKSPYRFPNFLIDNLILFLKDARQIYALHRCYERTYFNEALVKQHLQIFQNLAKEYHNKFVIYKDLFNGNKLKEYTELIREKDIEKEKNILLEEKHTELTKENKKQYDILIKEKNELDEKYKIIIEDKDRKIALKETRAQLILEHSEFLEEKIKELEKEHEDEYIIYDELYDKHEKQTKELNELTQENIKLTQDNIKYIDTISSLNEKIFQLKKQIADLSVAQNRNPFD